MLMPTDVAVHKLPHFRHLVQQHQGLAPGRQLLSFQWLQIPGLIFMN